MKNRNANKTIYFIHGGPFGILFYAGFYLTKAQAVRALRKRKLGDLKDIKGCKVVAARAARGEE